MGNVVAAKKDQRQPSRGRGTGHGQLTLVEHALCPLDPDASRLLRPFVLAPGEVADLVAFLRALTSDERPGLARHAWKERAETTRLRVVDAAGRPLAGLAFRVVPAGDRRPGARPEDRRGKDLVTDDDGLITDFMVMVRPMSGMHAVAEAMKRKLEGLA